MGHNADDKRVQGGVGVGVGVGGGGGRTCWRSQDVRRVQEVLRDDAHGAVQLADPPAVDVVLLGKNKRRRTDK